VDCPETIAMVKAVARAARSRGHATTMGGSVSAQTRQLLNEDAELRELVSCVETRKCVMRVPDFLQNGALSTAFVVEAMLLEMQATFHGGIANAASDRTAQIRSRL
jgi:hypothetical protein